MSSPGAASFGVPVDGATGLVRRVEDLARRLEQLAGLLGATSTAPTTFADIITALAATLERGDDGGTAFTQSTLATWQTGSIALTVNVQAGAMLVIASGLVQCLSPAPGEALFGWRLDGPTTVAETLTRGFGAKSHGSNSTEVQGSAVELHTGLAAGAYTVTDSYYSNTTGGVFSNRKLIAIPF